MKIQHNQLFSGCEKQHNGKNRHQKTDDKLKPEGIAYSFLASLPIILGGKNSGAGNTAENTDIEHRHKLVYNGNAAHLLCPYLPHHNIIQKTHKVGNSILDNNGHHNHQNHPVKRLIPCVFFPKILFHPCSLLSSSLFFPFPFFSDFSILAHMTSGYNMISLESHTLLQSLSQTGLSPLAGLIQQENNPTDINYGIDCNARQQQQQCQDCHRVQQKEPIFSSVR